MITYQDLLAVPQNDADRADFVRRVITSHQQSPLYKTAKIADDYERGLNTTTVNYTKTLTTLAGKLVPDMWSPNHKSTSNFFNIIITQLSNFLLGNGVQWKNKDAVLAKLGKDFDQRMQDAGKKALSAGVSFGFFNMDRVQIFSALEFAPLFDEEDSGLKSGVRYWQIDSSKPLRATLLELDGYTEYLFTKGNIPGKPWVKVPSRDAYMIPKRPYIIYYRQNELDGVQEIYDGANYPAFPVVPFWGNPLKQSELVGLREKIDAYDLILNGFENELDNAQYFWILKGAAGSDDIDLRQFLDRIKFVHAAAPADGQEVDVKEINIPYEAREKLLDRLERQIYKDAMVRNPSEVSGGALTATEIQAAYEPQNVKTDQFEFCALDFLRGIMNVAGIEDEPTFTRSMIINRQEEIQTVVQAADCLSDDYVTRKILTILGDGDKADEVLKQRDEEAQQRFAETETDEETEEGTNVGSNNQE